MLQGHGAIKAKLRRRSVERGYGYRVIEHIVEPAQTSWNGRGIQSRFEEPQVVTLPRPEDHSMLAQTHLPRIAIHRDMAHGEERHFSVGSRWSVGRWCRPRRFRSSRPGSL